MTKPILQIIKKNVVLENKCDALKAEVERLNGLLSLATISNEMGYDELDKQKAQVERLTAENATLNGIYAVRSLKVENEKLRAYCYKYGVCTQCGYMCSADGEFHVCKEGAVPPAKEKEQP